jgi:hypothetical protein
MSMRGECGGPDQLPHTASSGWGRNGDLSYGGMTHLIHKIVARRAAALPLGALLDVRARAGCDPIGLPRGECALRRAREGCTPTRTDARAGARMRSYAIVHTQQGNSCPLDAHAGPGRKIGGTGGH